MSVCVCASAYVERGVLELVFPGLIIDLLLQEGVQHNKYPMLLHKYIQTAQYKRSMPSNDIERRFLKFETSLIHAFILVILLLAPTP